MIIEMELDGGQHFFCPNCGKELIGYGSAIGEAYCEHVLLFFDSLAGDMEYIRSDVGDVDTYFDSSEDEDDPFLTLARYIDEVEKRYPNSLFFKFEDSMGGECCVGIEMKKGIKVKNNELDILQLSTATDIEIEDLYKKGDDIVAQGYGRKMGQVYVFTPSAIDYLKK